MPPRCVEPSRVQDSEGRPLDLSGFSPINIQNLSVKCGQCQTYQTLSDFTQREDWNVYSYECENGVCDREKTRTLIEVPRELDEFARRDPGWHDGKRHAGSSDDS